MNVFQHYARYYDLLYRDKDYGAEAGFVHQLLQKHRPGAKKLLELGSGTGRHAAELAKLSYDVQGVDQSPEMVAESRERAARLAGVSPEQLSFSVADARSVRIGTDFDAVLALFHVLSYQITNHDLRDVFLTASAHLRAGGVFIFDVWYGPAVLTDRPAVRVKRLEDEALCVTRLAEPTINPRHNTVDVNYTMLVREKSSGRIDEFTETHHMRYLFEPELEEFARSAGLRVADAGRWMAATAPGFDSWFAHFVAVKFDSGNAATR